MSSDQVRDAAASRLGATLSGKYRLDALLGLGGMAAVYAATHRNGSRVAIKLLHRELSRLDDVRVRFVREGYVANRIRHPGVVRVLDDDVDAEGNAYLVMELLEGCTLEQRRLDAGGRIGIDEAIAYVARILEILASGHEAGIVHRDIKPENVFLTIDGGVKVMDFGIARLLDGSGATRSGVLIGTPAFMSPEQAGGRTGDVDARSDVWSVGALFFVCVTGEDVHVARSGAEQVIFAATQPARSIARLAAHLPPDIAHVVDVALAFERERRWQTASAMRCALENAATTAGVWRSSLPEIAVRSPSGPPVSQPTEILGSVRRTE